MDTYTKEIIWNQFGAAIDALENAIRACPEKVWSDREPYHEYWYWAYHTLFWLDYYLEAKAEGFMPPEPFTLSEIAPEGGLPERVYSQDELLAYLAASREKCKNIVLNLDDTQLARTYPMRGVDVTYGELLLYNMRHVQHHAAQLNLLLRQRIGSAPGWTFRAKE